MPFTITTIPGIDKVASYVYCTYGFHQLAGTVYLSHALQYHI